jgi:hypothetical protein
MSRVFISEGTGATVYVFADDHCAPHVHARHRGEEWIARVEFSYLSNPLHLISIKPTQNEPSQRVINRLLDDIQNKLSDCRQKWWITKQTTCLTNQWALVPAAGRIDVLSKHRPGAKQIAGASYDPTTERVLVSFRDSSTTEVRLRP